MGTGAGHDPNITNQAQQLNKPLESLRGQPSAVITVNIKKRLYIALQDQDLQQPGTLPSGYKIIPYWQQVDISHLPGQISHQEPVTCSKLDTPVIQELLAKPEVSAAQVALLFRRCQPRLDKLHKQATTPQGHYTIREGPEIPVIVDGTL